MMIMPSNNTSGLVHMLAGRYPGSIGLFISPDGWRVPKDWFPYALDNGCFIEWNEKKFYKMLCAASFCHNPMFVVVPDVVGDAEATLRQWHNHHARVRSFGYKLAFACQDGMVRGDVPKDADCCFIGGTTDWKLNNAYNFKGVTPWLHIGRVNTQERIDWADSIGADSVDGTGFFRGDKKQTQALREYIERRQQRFSF